MVPLNLSLTQKLASFINDDTVHTYWWVRNRNSTIVFMTNVEYVPNILELNLVFRRHFHGVRLLA